MKTKRLIQIVLGGILALQLGSTCSGQGSYAGITISNFTTFTLGAASGGSIMANSPLLTWSEGGVLYSPLDHSEIYGAIEVARSVGIATGSGSLNIKPGEYDGQPSALVSGFETSYTLFHLTGANGYNYRLISSVHVSGNVQGRVTFAGVPNSGSGEFQVSAFLPPGEYVLEASLNTGASDSGGQGALSYALALLPAAVGGKYTAAEKRDLFLAGSSYRLLAQTLIIAGDSAPPSCECQAAIFATSQEVWRIAVALLHISEDPLDTNYTALVQPEAPVVVPLVAGGDVTQPEADAYNQWQTNLSLGAAYSTALATSVDRAQGAAYAGSPSWETAQMNAAVQFEALLASLADQEPALRSNVVAQFQAGGFSAITVSSNDAVNLQTQIITNGLPTNLLATLTAQGVDPDTITNIQNTLLTADPNALAGSFPGSLADTNLDVTAHTIAANLRDASLMLINPSVLPGGQFRFDLATEPGYTYSIQSSENLADPTGWATIFTTNASTTLLSFTNPAVAGAQAVFYRASHN